MLYSKLTFFILPIHVYFAIIFYVQQTEHSNEVYPFYYILNEGGEENAQ